MKTLTTEECAQIVDALYHALMLADVVGDNLSGTNAHANATLADAVRRFRAAKEIVSR